jgi:hypothetical protein
MDSLIDHGSVERDNRISSLINAGATLKEEDIGTLSRLRRNCYSPKLEANLTISYIWKFRTASNLETQHA